MKSKMKALLLFMITVLTVLAFTVAAWRSEEAEHLHALLKSSSLTEKVAEVTADKILLHTLQRSRSIVVRDANRNTITIIRKERIYNDPLIEIVLNGNTVSVHMKNSVTDDAWKVLRSYEFSDRELMDLYQIGDYIQLHLGNEYVNKALRQL